MSTNVNMVVEKGMEKDHSSDQDDEKHVSSESYQVGSIEPASSDAIRENFKEKYPAPVVWVLEKLFASGAEARGIERVPENERKKSGVWDQMLFWFSVRQPNTRILSSKVY
jgi:hypothetical protein